MARSSQNIKDQSEVKLYMYVCVPSLQSCLTVCDPIGCSLPASSVQGIFQARILQWVPTSPPGYLPNPGMEPTFFASPELAVGFFTSDLCGSPCKH